MNNMSDACHVVPGPHEFAAADRPDTPRLSVIVPVYNNASDLGQCIAALKASASAETEIIVVNDASTDDSAAAARAGGVHVVEMSRNSGPAAARNHGAARARGDVLVFVDADVVVATDALDRIRRVFDADPELAAVFGSYDASPRAPGVVSQYRNLLHHFTHQQANSAASTFWAGCGAIRRDAFEAVDRLLEPVVAVGDRHVGTDRDPAFEHGRGSALQRRSLKRWILPVAVFGSSPANSIQRGYL